MPMANGYHPKGPGSHFSDMPILSVRHDIIDRRRRTTSVELNSMRISYHCLKESLVDLQEGQLIPQYYYVSNSNRHVNTKDDYMTLHYSGFCW